MIKNSLFIVSLVVVLVSSVSARLNPFEPTKTYEEEKQALNKLALSNPDDGNRTVKIIPANEPKKKVIQPLVKSIAPQKIIKPKILDKDMSPIKEVVLVDKKVVKNLPIKESIKPLPFVSINIVDEVLTIESNYKLKKKFIIKEEKKLVFDFKAKVNFYTTRDNTKVSKEFKKVTIGNHPKYSYFRVVIETKDELSNYKVKINKKESVSISKTIRN